MQEVNVYEYDYGCDEIYAGPYSCTYSVHVAVRVHDPPGTWG